MNSPTTGKKLKPRTDLAIESVEGNLLILDKRHEKIHELNATASAVWQGIQEDRETDSIVDAIVENFDITHEIARSDVSRTMDEFHKLNLLEEHSAY